MRRQVVSWTLVMCFGAAISVASAMPTSDKTEQLSPLAVEAVTGPGSGMSDEATMVLLGSALIGLAAAVRRAA
jgi:hypothetical protein